MTSCTGPAILSRRPQQLRLAAVPKATSSEITYHGYYGDSMATVVTVCKLESCDKLDSESVHWPSDRCSTDTE